jgi:hypothetical protein
VDSQRRPARARLAAGLTIALIAAAPAGCGGGDDDADRMPAPPPVTAADIREGARAMAAARDCPALYDAGAGILSDFRRSRSVREGPDTRAALREADAAMAGTLRRLGCAQREHVCTELAERVDGLSRRELEC